MQASEIREMSDEDIRARVAELEEERFRLKFRSATETLEDPLRLRFIRKDVARLKTVLRERELGTGGAAPVAAAEGGKAGVRGGKAATKGAKRGGKAATKRRGATR
jgi:large subunit ribosomal protein L29